GRRAPLHGVRGLGNPEGPDHPVVPQEARREARRENRGAGVHVVPRDPAGTEHVEAVARRRGEAREGPPGRGRGGGPEGRGEAGEEGEEGGGSGCPGSGTPA